MSDAVVPKRAPMNSSPTPSRRRSAARLRRGEDRIADRYPAATVLFADIEGFAPWAQGTDPSRVVTLLDSLFSRFDELVASHGLEKIKTIGRLLHGGRWGAERTS